MLHPAQLKRYALPALVVLGALVGVGAARWRRANTTFHMGQPIPLEGLVVNPRGGNLGDPANAERDFRRLYAALIAYRTANGALPPLSVLFDTTRPIGTVQLTKDDFENPDYRYSDAYSPQARNPSHYAFAYIAPRPDGTPKPASPKAGERDIWLYCEDYRRDNQRVAHDRHSTMDIRGVYVVLWSDGEIQRIRAGDARMVSTSARASELHFPGEAGLPKRTTSVADSYRNDDFNDVKVDGKSVRG